MRRKALVVDDVECHRLAVSSYLVLKGFSIETARDGMEAFKKMTDHKTPLYQIIISDIEMPNMNGFELLARVRKNEIYKKTPIIIVSSVSNKVDIERARRLGATGYLVKPYTAKKMNTVLDRIGIN